MRTILLSLFCAFVLNAQSVEVKKDTVDKYVIDKQVIENFDGTQLEGKTISKYMIAYKDARSFVEKIHVIFTIEKSVTINSALTGDLNGAVFEGLIIVDGKEIERKELGNIIKTEDIANVNVFKPGSKIADSYGEKGKNGVLMITTKEGNSVSSNIYFIDGKRVDESEVHKLSSDKIANMTVKKEEGASVIYIVKKK